MENVTTNHNKTPKTSSEPIISIILPSRKRYQKAKNFLFSLKENCVKPDLIEIILCIDSDDDSYDKFDHVFEHTKIINETRRNLGQSIFEGIKNSTGEIIFICNDDVSVETSGWDEEFRIVHNTFTDGIYLFSPNDLNKKGSLFVFPGFSKKVFKILHDYPKRYSGAFMDNHLDEVFESLKYNGFDRKIFLREVVFNHQHYTVTGQPPDETYTDRDRFGDDANFFNSVKTRHLETMSIKSFIETGRSFEKQPTVKLSITNSVLFYLFSSHLPVPNRLKLLYYMFARYTYKSLFRLMVKARQK